jgi:hypothetical protein
MPLRCSRFYKAALAAALILTAISSNAWQMKQAPLMTRWASLVDTNAPLPEYPRPQLVRSNWLNLNGIWQFQAGATNDPAPTNQTLSSSILVPYPMESAISGVMQYYAWSWYRQTFTVPPAWSGSRIILHLDAVNWQSEVFINGQSLGVHKGGYDAFSYDVTPYLIGSGAQELIVRVYNPVDNGSQPRGKQTLYPGGIMYTSSSGIWRSVWLEPVSASGVQSLTIIPDVDNSRLRLTVTTYATNGITVSASVLDGAVVVTHLTGSPLSELSLPISSPKLWSPDNPYLYGLQVSVIQGGVTNDTVSSYFGMRKISIGTVNGIKKMLLNNQVLFEMGPLDQGFWPDGTYTAPTDDALKFDIQQAKNLGFNMIRKHIKVERDRWYYWADTLGMLVWQDMPSCNSYTGNPSPPAVDATQFQTELSRMVLTHINSPAVIMWDIFNEAQGQENTSGGVGQATTASLVQLVNALDPSRLVNQASGGNYYGVGDVLDNHSYPAPGNPASSTQAPVDGEYGGIGFQMAGHLWNPALAGGNYVGANTTNDIATIYDSFAIDLVYSKASGGLNAAVYTQITDVENECNGLFTYDRVLKPALNQILTSNEKAVTGQMTVTDVLPTSQNSGRTWKYTTNTNVASAAWYATNYDDSAWSSGMAGFGTAGTPGAVVRTTWNTADIWIRQQFTLGTLTPSALNNLIFNCYHDEDCEIFVNGVLGATASGYSTAYVLLDMSGAAKSALITNGVNLIAVHCHQTTGGQNIDVGISQRNLIADTLTVPTDPGGYWKLDESSGFVATDSSGGTNNGLVSSPVWTPLGKVQGCLTFNGASSYARISRTISNDFSVAFWARTAQTGGTGQWWEGKGLVDGEVAVNTNDFGTSLCGSKFAFGTGNPDTTITSVTRINDSAWHYCVATREQASGTLKVYVDGVLETTGTGSTQSLTAAASLRFGSLQTGVNFLQGSMDEVQVYNRALGHLEVAALYNDSAYPPPAPTGLSAVAANGQIALSWADSTGASSYVLGRSSNPGGPYSALASVAAPGFTDVGLTNGVTYYYVVWAVNTAGQGAPSLEVSATPFTLAAWFKADAITGVANGSALATWPDASGNGYDATQGTPAQRPTYVTGAMNGLPAVRFNSANSTFLAFSRPVQDDFTILCVYRSSQGYGTDTDFFSGAGLVNGEVAGVAADFGVSLSTNGFLLAGTGNPDTTVVSSSFGYANGQPHLFTFKRTESTAALVLYADGVQAGTATGGTESLTAPTRLVLGAQQTLINYLTGDIAEVKIFNSPLSDSDRAAEESALKCKYGIPGGGAPPAVPFGLSASAGNRQISVTWVPTVGATSYNLWRSTNNGASYALLASGLPTSSFVDTNAVSGRTNYYEVAAASVCGMSANSAPVSVWLPLPALAFSSAGGVLAVSWPAWASDWELWSATNLTFPVAWSLVTNVISSTNGQFMAFLPIGPGACFFRLASP